ncbi:efflux RND transporter periplasmic adaptor subunit [Orenia marismortui]|uniref:efflux RND transporter periplasmic adaptor subunit n=1 Tax=Orenia marismortui TaxID=46469 RepID=UPI00035D9C9C|nr:efflux RND transporter periplasmic adaptor subunit [Orenia marismortui]
MKILSNKKLVVVLLIAILSFSIIGCGKKNEETIANQKEEKPKIPVESITAKADQLSDYVTVVGSTEASKSVQLTPQVQEEVEKVYVKVGDKVNKGDRLLVLDKDTLKIQVEQAEAGLKAAQANLDKALRGAREEEIAQLKARLEQAKASYEETEKAYNRQETLYKQHVISEQQFESMKSKYIAAKSGYETAKQSLKLAQNGATEEEIKALEAQVSQAKASYQAANIRLSKAEIKAPISGIISAVNIEEGEMAGGQPVIAIANIDQVKIVAYVSERNINKVNLGDKVEVDFNALERLVTGRVDSISPVMDQQKKAFPVEIIIDNQDNLIKGGMYAEINLVSERINNKVVIPQESIFEEADIEYVYIIKDGAAERRKVETGLSAAGKVVILSGIKEGEEVVVTGQEDLGAGAKVQVVNRGDN